MKKIGVWCVCLMAFLLCYAGTGIAEGEYEALCAENSLDSADVTAWIEIPEAGFCEPVMQKAGDDSFYSTHDASGAEAQYGALYTQAAYNADDFSDPVTVIYGSSRAEGAPFRDLQEMYSGSFDELGRIILHLPDKTLEYEVFAAVPYSSLHILHYFDFAVERRYNSFFDDVYATRLLGMHLDAEEKPAYGDNVVILSTGLRGDDMQRYLVMAKLVK